MSPQLKGPIFSVKQSDPACTKPPNPGNCKRYKTNLKIDGCFTSFPLNAFSLQMEVSSQNI